MSRTSASLCARARCAPRSVRERSHGMGRVSSGRLIQELTGAGAGVDSNNNWWLIWHIGEHRCD